MPVVLTVVGPTIAVVLDELPIDVVAEPVVLTFVGPTIVTVPVEFPIEVLDVPL